MLKNFCEYRQEIFEGEFKSTPLYRKLAEDFGFVFFDKLIESDPPELYAMTPRQQFGDSRGTRFSAVPFYYLEFLTSKNPATIYDLGCGWNIFKKYIPNIIGIGAEPTTSRFFFADIQDFVDETYVAGHQNHFESVFSINALHFHPLSQLKKCVTDFYSMIKPNGTGWLTLNAKRMIERDMEKFGNKDIEHLENFVRTELAKTDITYLVVDIDLSVLDEYMNGNIRLVMQK